jgi:hypothetical protein
MQVADMPRPREIHRVDVIRSSFQGSKIVYLLLGISSRREMKKHISIFGIVKFMKGGSIYTL